MTQNEYDYKVGYLDAFSDVLAMLASIPETPEVYKIKESLRETIEKGSEELWVNTRLQLNTPSATSMRLR